MSSSMMRSLQALRGHAFKQATSCPARKTLANGRTLFSRVQVAQADAASTSKPNIQKLAKMAQIEITEQEAKDMEPKINSILNWFDQLQSVNTEGVVPAIHASEQGTVLRNDQPEAYSDRSALLQQAPALDKTYIRVPKIATAADADAKKTSPSPSPAASTSSTDGSSTAGSTDEGAGPSQAAADALKVLDFRVGRIISCEKHPEADSLYVEKIDIGEAEPRTIVSGLVKYVPIEEMVNRMVVVIANLKPRNMRGIKSAGMVLAASDDPKTTVVPVIPPEGAQPGERLWFGDNKEQPAPAVPNAVEKKKLWEVVSPGLRTNSEGVACWHGSPMTTSAGAVKAPTLPDCRVA